MIGWVVVFDVVVDMFGSFFVGFVDCMVDFVNCMVGFVRSFVSCYPIFDLLHCCCCPYFLVGDCLSNFDCGTHSLDCSFLLDKGALG